MHAAQPKVILLGGNRERKAKEEINGEYQGGLGRHGKKRLGDNAERKHRIYGCSGLD